MNCRQCGRENLERAKFCGGCGASLTDQEIPPYSSDPLSLPRVSFATAVQLGFSRFLDFRGRSTRAEYWWFSLFIVIGSVITSLVDGILGTGGPNGGLIEVLFSLITLIPSLSLGVRRLHDINRTGWWLLIYFTIVGIILVIVWAIKQGDEGLNRYGTDPRQQSP